MYTDTLAMVAGDVAAPSPETLAAGRRQLDGAVDLAGLRVVAARRRTRRRRWGFSTLTAAAAAVGALLVVPVMTAGPASADAVLLAAADAAGQQADTADGAPYWYVRSEVEYPDTGPAGREIWQARTGTSVLRDEADAILTAQINGTAVDIRTEAQDHIEGVDGGMAVFIVGGHALTWQDLDALPTDPTELGALLREMVAGHPSGEDNELWESVTGLLSESPASPELRRALWQVAATIPGVDLLGVVTDSAGRQGTVIERNELDQGWYRLRYTLDPVTGALLEWQTIDGDGAVVYRWTLLEQGPSQTAPAAQAPVCGPGSEPYRSC